MSGATKFRWRQVRDFVTGDFSQWALDDISIDVEVLNPAVLLTCPIKGNKAALITVVAQFSQPVDGFEPTDVTVHNGAPPTRLLPHLPTWPPRGRHLSSRRATSFPPHIWRCQGF